MTLKHLLLVSVPAMLCTSTGAFAQSAQDTVAPPAGVAPAPLGAEAPSTTTGIPAGAPVSQSPPEESRADSGVQDIVVTAQKREQNLQDVPVSISAVGEQAIVANKIYDVSDLSRIAPNLTVREGAGGSKLPQYSMRGIYTFGSAAGTDKGVSLYIDGVYIQSVAGSVFEFADIQRVEILRGPQGTLFGRNATGGAVSVITRDPTGEFGLRQDFTYGNYDQLRSKTRIDLPKFGPFSITASYLHSEREGDVRNLGAGTVWDHSFATGGRIGQRVSPKRLGNENVEGIFAAVDIDLHPDLDLKYKFDYSENDFSSTAVGISYLPGASAFQFGGFAPPVGTQVGGANASTFVAALARYNEQNPALRTPITTKRPDAVNNAFTQPGRTKAYGHNFTARWRINDSVSVKNILSFRHAESLNPGFQLDGLGGLRGQSAIGQGGVPVVPANGGLGVFGAPVAGSAGFPVLLLANNSFNNQDQWSNEFQVNYDSDLLTLTAGYIHFHDNQKTGGVSGEFNTITFAPFVGQGTPAAGTPFVIPANTGFRGPRVRVNSDAVFAQPEIHVTDQLDVVGGIRVTRDRKDGQELIPGSIFPYNPSNGRGQQVIRYRDTRETFLVGVNYKPNSDVLLYGKYVTGYISGGQLATIQFDPETAKSAEIGGKFDLFDRRLRSNLSLFHVKYGSIQQATSGTLTGVPAAFFFGQAIVPVGNATAKGFEWENTAVPIEGVTLQANVGYTDFKFDQDTIFGGFAFNSGAPGYPPIQRPKWTINGSAQYETPEVIAGGTLLFRADASFKSRTFITSDYTPGNGPTSQADPALVRSLTAPASWVVNGRIALNGFDLAGSKATLAVFGKNIFNNRNIINGTSLGFVSSVLYERARTYGVDLSFEF